MSITGSEGFFFPPMDVRIRETPRTVHPLHAVIGRTIRFEAKKAERQNHVNKTVPAQAERGRASFVMERAEESQLKARGRQSCC